MENSDIKKLLECALLECEKTNTDIQTIDINKLYQEVASSEVKFPKYSETTIKLYLSQFQQLSKSLGSKDCASIFSIYDSDLKSTPDSNTILFTRSAVMYIAICKKGNLSMQSSAKTVKSYAKNNDLLPELFLSLLDGVEYFVRTLSKADPYDYDIIRSAILEVGNMLKVVS